MLYSELYGRKESEIEMGEKEDIEKMVKESFKRGDADKDWESRETVENAKNASNEPDPADDLPPTD